MQCASYLPGCYSTRDLNAGANGSTWPLYNHDRTWKSGQAFNVLLPTSTANQYLWYDQEVLRQTMLKHEATFRDQVHELHRLYERQRELMEEIKRREIYKHHLQLQTIQSSSFLSQLPSELSQMSGKISNSAWVNPANNGPSALSAENCQAHSSPFTGKSMQAHADPDLSKTSLKDSEMLSSKSKKSGKKMLDLELPADAYIDSEEGEQFEEEATKVPFYPPKRVLEIFPKSDSEQFLCSGEFNYICQEGSSRPDPVVRKSSDLVDLNEPIKHEEAVTSSNLLGSDTSHVNFPYRDQALSKNPNIGFPVLTKEIVHNIQAGKYLEARSDIIDMKKDRQQELQPYSDEVGEDFALSLHEVPVIGRRGSSFNSLQISSSEELPVSCVQLQAHEQPTFNLLNESTHKQWTEKTNLGLEIYERNVPSNDNCAKQFSSCMPTSCQLIPCYDMANSEPSLVSSRRKLARNLRQIPVAVQALPCFNSPVSLSKSPKSSSGSPGFNGNKFPLNRNSMCSPSSGSLSILQKSLVTGSLSECLAPLSTSVNSLGCKDDNDTTSELHNLAKCFKNSDYIGGNSAKVMDLNSMPPSCLLGTVVSQEKVRTTEGEKKLADSLGGLCWLREETNSAGKLDKKYEELIQVESGFSQAFPTFVYDVKPKRSGTSDCSDNKKILGFSSFDKPRISSDQFSLHTSSSNSHTDPSEVDGIENSGKVGVHHRASPHYPTFDSGKCCYKNSVVNVGVDHKLSGFGNHIDLNSCSNEDEPSLTAYIPSVSMKTEAETGLEAPVSPENKECSPPRGESEEHQPNISLQLSKEEDGDPEGELFKIAAEVIVSISSSGIQLVLESAACELSEASNDSLHWFAGIVSSIAGNLENKINIVSRSSVDGDQNELLPDGTDYFEAMTLKLTETTVEEYCCMSNDQRKKETGDVLLPRQPTRGRARRARQRKDFQAEVLPSLASLSRHEVTEDLQIIGGLMEAASTTSDTGLGRGNTGRNGCMRGRKRSSIYPSSVKENTLCSNSEQQTSKSELVLGERGLTGWGKANRRRRRQRCPASNSPLVS